MTNQESQTPAPPPAQHAVPRPAPDDAEADRAIAEASDLIDALWAISEKYDVPLTNNYARWQDGQYLREAGDFIGDILDAMRRFPLPDPAPPADANQSPS